LTTLLLSLLSAGCTSTDTRVNPPPPTTQTLSPAQPPTVANVLVGTFRGTLSDGEHHLPVITTFRTTPTGTLVGGYSIDEGTQTLTGELEEFVDVWPELFMCRFTWRDKHGKGLLIITALPDGSAFKGFWGDEIADPQLKWEGQRVTR
jgi:hypothetical protein